MQNMNNINIDMNTVIGNLAYEHGVPALSYDALIELGKRAVTVYGLHDRATKITFAELCHYIVLFISTPFGLRQLHTLAEEGIK